MNKENNFSLFNLGCLVNLRIRMWSGRKMLTRGDLQRIGYDPNKLPSDIVNLGRKLMVPKSELHALTHIDQKSRNILEKWSMPFGISNAHFVPAKMLPTVEAQLKELKEEFFEKVDSLIARFDDLVDTVKQAHPDFWEKCLRNHYPANPKALRSKFQFNWYTFKISGIDTKETSVSEAMTEHQLQIEKNQELRKQMQEEVNRFVEDYVITMRQETVKFCELVQARVNGTAFGDETESKILTPRSIGCFRKYIDKFKNMNIFGDKEIEKMLDEFKNQFLNSGVGPKDFESSNVKAGVTMALEAIRQKAATETESAGQFIGELKRRIVL
ncbi:MAG: hypothetical protein JSW11_00945 [Candidatus Heimdallarchaeota archaeon]|nr:MAG: hypothetical protein JSW11_00945 [Candidatus Heimdallarchaeota archaeon]